MKQILLLLLLFPTLVFGAVNIEDDTNDFYAQADGLSSDLSGSNQQFTLLARFIHEGTVDAGAIISKENTASGQRQFAMLINSSDVLICPVSSNGAANTTGTSTTTILPDVEYSAACVYDDVTIQPYVNGVAEGGSAHTAGVFNGSAQFQVGQRSGVDNNFDGIIREICQYNTALTAAEIAAYHDPKMKRSCIQIRPTNLIMNCAMDDCADGVACTTLKCTPGSNLTASGSPTGAAENVLSYP